MIGLEAPLQAGGPPCRGGWQGLEASSSSSQLTLLFLALECSSQAPLQFCLSCFCVAVPLQEILQQEWNKRGEGEEIRGARKNRRSWLGWAGGEWELFSSPALLPPPPPEALCPPFCLSWGWGHQVIPSSLSTTTDKTSIVLVNSGLGWLHPLPSHSVTSGEVIPRIGWAGRVSPQPHSGHTSGPLKEPLCENEQPSSGPGDRGLV